MIQNRVPGFRAAATRGFREALPHDLPPGVRDYALAVSDVRRLPLALRRHHPWLSSVSPRLS
jgi:hypothetical protein